jgi:hypothetical protein
VSAGSGHGDDVAIGEEAARADIGRLTAMRDFGLAVEIMKAWSLGGAAPAGGMATLTQADLAGWLLRDYPQCTRLLPLLRSVVRESCDLLVDAGLLEQPKPVYAVSPGGGSWRRADATRPD